MYGNKLPEEKNLSDRNRFVLSVKREVNEKMDAFWSHPSFLLIFANEF